MSNEDQSSTATNINNETPDINISSYSYDEAQSNSDDDQNFLHIDDTNDKDSNEPLLDSHIQRKFPY